MFGWKLWMIWTGIFLALPFKGLAQNQQQVDFSQTLTPEGAEKQIELSLAECITLALKSNLNIALDQLKSAASAAMEVKIELKRDQINWTGIAFGVLACTYGVANYYIVPLAMVSFNFALMLEIFMLILVGMLLGLTLLSMNLQGLFEILTVYILCCF